MQSTTTSPRSRTGREAVLARSSKTSCVPPLGWSACTTREQQVGFARVFSDRHTLAYLADVYVLPEHRGRELGVELVREAVENSPFTPSRWLLHTRDAHDLYMKFGFGPVSERLMEKPRLADRRTRVLTMALAAGVAVAFADSSIVVLALPDLYGEFDTTLVGVSWVITSYNLVVAVAALCPRPLRAPPPAAADGNRRHRRSSPPARRAARQPGASTSLIGFRCLQGLGGALLLAASLRGLAAFAGTPARGAAVWTRPGRSAPPRGRRSAAC